MPTYEYRCTKGHTFDVFQSISADPVTVCQVCGRPVERVMHSPAVHFKGSGFYNTDYGTKKRQREQKSSSDSGSSEPSTPTPTEPTPAKSDSAASSDSKASTEKAKPKRSSE